MSKKITEQIIDKNKKEKKMEIEKFISSGSTLLDLALGGGFPAGKIINIVGDKSTGKTLLAIETIAKNRKKIKWFYDDSEAGFSFDTRNMYGFDMNVSNNCSFTIEDFEKNISKQLKELKENKTLVYVLDCFDSLTSEAEIKRHEKESEKGSYKVEKTKILSEFFRLTRQKIKNKNCILIIISQVRMNIGIMFGEKYTRTGGKALDHYSSQIIWLAETEKHKRKDRVTGVTVKVKVKKNKVGLPFRECFVDILFDYGIDDISSNLCFLYDLKTPTGKMKSKEKIEWIDGNKYSLRKLIKHIEENNLEEDLKKEVIKKWDDIENSVSSKERKNKF